MRSIPYVQVVRGNGAEIGNLIRENMIILRDNANLLLTRKYSVDLNQNGGLEITQIGDGLPNITDLKNNLVRVSEEMREIALNNSKAGVTMCERLITGIKQWYNEFDAKLQEITNRRRNPGLGEGIAKYRHI